jgi:very-short-patch-repair endonuclease
MKKDWLKISGMHDGAKPIIFKNAAKLRKNMTEPEIILWNYLRKKPFGFKFRRQHPIQVYVLDFYCHKLKLSIEIDGAYHTSIEQKEKDFARTIDLNEVGIKEIRFTNDDVLNHFELVIEKIECELERGHSL